MQTAVGDFYGHQEIGLISGLIGMIVGACLYFVMIQTSSILLSIFFDVANDAVLLIPMRPIETLNLKVSLQGLTHNIRGHFALGFWLLKFLCGYFVLYFLIGPRHISPDDTFTAPFYLVLMMTLWCQVVTLIAYFLDHYRMSIVFIAFIAFLLFGHVSDLEHRFHVVRLAKKHQDPKMPNRRPTVGDAPVASRLESQNAYSDIDDLPEDTAPVIVVVAPGGGIHAAAWTGKVLAGLHEHFGTKFERSLKLVSAVSGGSVGAMYYLDNYPTLKLAHASIRESEYAREKFARTVRKVAEVSSISSLESLAWGATFPDTARLFLGKWVRQDRADIHEQQWLRNMDVDEGIGPTLFDWRDKAIKNELPWVAFNATEAETGRRVLFSTLKMSPVPDTNEQSRAIDFLSISNDQFDLPISTAVRLSATFPYISPAAMPANDTLAIGHVVDGGYADNDGLLTAIEAIRQWSGKDSKREFILICIDHIPPLAHQLVTAVDPGLRGSGWEYASVGPLIAMGNVRTTSQRERGEIELRLLAEKMHETLRVVSIQFPTIDGLKAPPLNWKLSVNQRNAYETAWKIIQESASSGGRESKRPDRHRTTEHAVDSTPPSFKVGDFSDLNRWLNISEP